MGPRPTDIEDAKEAMLAIADGDGQCGMDCGVAERTCRFVDLPEPREADAALRWLPNVRRRGEPLPSKALAPQGFHQRARGDSNTQPPDP